jgi:eukaryotic-like serine/threonine-protein kinase
MITQIDLYDLQRAFAGHYSFVRELGRGGMGVVYLAREVELDRLVALKVLPPSLAEQRELRDRFLREARLAASLSHPHIVPIHRVGELGGFAFIAMAYVEGETLGERLRARGPLSPTFAARVLREIAWALAHAHARGVVHRDIKPDNILLEAGTGRALVSDFGIAEVARSGSVPGSSAVMGTAAFMSPEQAAGLALDSRSDIYSLGILGHLALTGRLPSSGDGAAALTAVVADDVAASLGRALARCLATKPEHRFANAELFADAIAQAAQPAPQLPQAIKQWLSERDPAAAVYSAWSATLGFIAISSFALESTPLTLGALGLALLPLATHGFYRFRRLKRVLRAGYTIDDLCLALRQQHVAQPPAERSTSQGGSRAQRTRRLLDRALLVSIAATFGGAALGATGIVGEPVFTTIMFSSVAALLSSLFVRGALGIPLPGVHMELRVAAARRAAFWNSRFGKWIAHIASPKGRDYALADLAHRRTEVAIALAADKLYAALPTMHREDLAELPDVIRELQEQATALRARIASLTILIDDASSGVGGDEVLGTVAADSGLTVADRRDAAVARLSASRDEARERLARCVAALEAMRLDLLRLQGGVIEAGALTTGVDAARRVAEDLRALADAHGELSQFNAAFSPSPA